MSIGVGHVPNFRSFLTPVDSEVADESYLEPADFVCLPVCAGPPPVLFGADLSYCAGTPAGEQCELRCVLGYTPGAAAVCNLTTGGARRATASGNRRATAVLTWGLRPQVERISLASEQRM